MVGVVGLGGFLMDDGLLIGVIMRTRITLDCTVSCVWYSRGGYFFFLFGYL